MTSAPPTRDGVVVSTLCTSEDTIDHETLGNLLQEGTQDHRVCGMPLHLLLCLMPLTAGRHVAQASSPVLDSTGYHIASDPR